MVEGILRIDAPEDGGRVFYNGRRDFMTRSFAFAFAVFALISTGALAQDAADATPVPTTMEEVEAAYRSQDFVTARAGLRHLAETEPAGNVMYRYARILLDPRAGPVDAPAAAIWLERAVEADYTPANTLLARVFLSGGDVERDPEHAAQLLQDSATRGDQEAQYYLALLYEAGDGVAQSERDAFVWYRAAAEQGHVEAAYSLSRAYSRGAGTELDTDKALHWLERSAGDGHVDAQFFLANALETGKGARQNRNEALNWYRRAAEGGHILSMRIIGTKYLQGEGVYQDNDAAMTWLTKAAEGGEPGALYNLGVIYGTGQIVERDDAKAMSYFESAADTGLLRAIGMQAAFLEAGRGAEADLSRAVGLYQTAAQEGHVPSQAALVRLAVGGDLDGLTTPHDMVALVAAAATDGDEAALKWLERASEAGVGPATTALGALLLNDTARADEGVALITKAARQGNASAQFQLGEAFSTGVGVAQDYEAAHMWLNLSAAQGHRQAGQSRDVLTDLMTPEQIRAAQTAAREFQPETPAGGVDQ